PANIINAVRKKLTGKEFDRHLKGNLGDSLVKFNVVNGSMAKTLPGKLVQNCITIPCESMGNFTNDKSGLGAFLCAMIMSLYNNTQDAPKGSKVATVADDYIGTMGSIAIATPLAFGATYGLASLKNLQHKGVISGILKGIGNIFGLGLSHYDAATNTMVKSGHPAARLIGGALRLALIMVIMTPKFQKPIKAAIHKVFGKPYDKAEAEREKQLEEQKNTMIPELGITQGELQERITKNPKALESLQENPQLIQAIDKNPKLILDLLDGKEINVEEVLKKPESKTQSPMLQNMIKNGKSNVSNQADLFGSKTKEKSEQKQEDKPKDTATYIPSSAFTAPAQPLSDATAQEYERLMARADKALAAAEKYI
ncbi:hypothetical protein IJ531_01055, partial [bacterium]|nr:hypothetical protein [bacterium]